MATSLIYFGIKKDCIVWEECSPEEKVMKKI